PNGVGFSLFTSVFGSTAFTAPVVDAAAGREPKSVGAGRVAGTGADSSAPSSSDTSSCTSGFAAGGLPNGVDFRATPFAESLAALLPAVPAARRGAPTGSGSSAPVRSGMPAALRSGAARAAAAGVAPV